ncbi:MAG: glutathione S-transferase family protein [Rhodospirillaceae bacterium]|jgi:glutathione S-transferase|nr:glutathione S-transferase family protein [Rhodospirillaceae bacterium]
MLTIYGNTRSRATRCVWALNELGVDYERNALDHIAGENKTPEYLALNPSGKVPTLVDGDVVMSESLAINLYLARKYDNGLWPSSEADRARAEQWTMWAAAEAEPHTLTIAIERMFKPEDARDEAKAKAAEEALGPRLTYIDAHLKDRDFLVGDQFSIADLNVGCVLASMLVTNVDLAGHPNLTRWLTATATRDAYAKAREA